MELTAHALEQRTEESLTRIEAGETVTVTMNGRPVAILCPYCPQDLVPYPFRTDPMGEDENVPTFRGAPDFAERVDDYLVGFGSDVRESSVGQSSL